MSPPEKRRRQSRSKPWYIHDQKWSILTADYQTQDEVKFFCQPRFYRLTADGVGSEEMKWFATSFEVADKPEEIALGSLSRKDQRGNSIDLRFTAIIADAGAGKTKLTEWVEYRCNQSDSRSIAFRFDLKTLVSRHGLNVDNCRRQFMQVVAEIWYRKLSDQQREVTTESQIADYLRSLMTHDGEVTLIFDGLDQCSKSELDVLATITDSSSHEFRGCRFVVAGRPQAYTTNWSSLFSNRPWRLVRVEGMSRDQQIRYLGWMPDGTARFSQIPRGARALLSNPRIMSYLREWNDFANIKTGADVYWKTIDRLVLDGMIRSEKASLIGLPAGRQPKYDAESSTYEVSGDQVRTAIDLLSIVAFETKRFCQKSKPSWTRNWYETGQLPSPPEQQPPAYDYNVASASETQKLRREHIKRRFEELYLDGDFETNWNGIAALNSGFLEHGVFEDDRGGLKELIWANKSLHEFLLAYYFANHATEEDTWFLWDWIYLKDQYATEDYYWFWQYLCDMPAEARCEENWLRSIRMLFQHGITQANKDGTRELLYAKRSCEMIFRSWWTLNDYVAAEGDLGGPATEIRDHWRGEFEQIRSGEYGQNCQGTAEEIVDHLMPIPLKQIGRFKMGTTPDRQGFAALSEDKKQNTRGFFESLRENPETAIAEYFDGFIQTKATVISRESCEPKWHRLAVDPDFEPAFEQFVADYFSENEAEIAYEDLPNEQLSDFSLGRHTVSNIFFRLFDPSHGQRESQLWSNYTKYSESEIHPCIYVDWFDSFVYCRFLFWDGSCHLPYEDQWECAVKLGFGWEDWQQNYWWADDYVVDRDRERVNIQPSGYGKTLEPSPKRASQWSKAIDPKGLGLMDMLGNVWEWCEDPFPDYSMPYRRQPDETKRDASVSRSCRGASFADYYVNDARCSYRLLNDPSVAGLFYGFRVARARKS